MNIAPHLQATKIESHLDWIAKGSKRRPAPDQFEFTVNKTARRIARWFDAPANREMVRIQGNRAFSWQGEVFLPDTSAGTLRSLPCTVVVDGSIPADETNCRRTLEAMLQAGFDYDLLFRHPLDHAINDQRIILRGAFIDTIQDPHARRRIEDAMALELRHAGLPAESVALSTPSSDKRVHLDFEDNAGSLTIRSRGSLESNRVGYKARLVWGRTGEQMVARLAYIGTVDGQTESPLERPLVDGQVQPVEAYFRRLLATALAEETWGSVLTGDAQMLDNVRARASGPLGRGTGRIVDSLVLYPALANTPHTGALSWRFTSTHRVLGIDSEGIRIEHSITYELADRDRWMLQGAPDPQAFLQREVTEATRVYLADKRFEHIIELYLSEGGEAKVRDGIGSRVGGAARSIGYRLTSNAAILEIAEIDYIHGHTLKFAEAKYSLADPHLAPSIRLAAVARVLDSDEDRKNFARAVARHEVFEDLVRTCITETVRGELRGFGALSYYASPYVNGAPLPPDRPSDPWRVASPADDPFRSHLWKKVNDQLKTRFGLTLTGFDLEPGEDDKLIDRMRALTRMPIRLVDHEIGFDRGDTTTTIIMRVTATLFVIAIDQANWSSFYHSAERYDSHDEHKAQLIGLLIQTLRLLEPVVVVGELTDLRSGKFHSQIIERFGERVREEFGLIVRLSPLTLRVSRPRVGETAEAELQALREELGIWLKRRSMARTADDTTYQSEGDTRDQINRRITAIREEIDEVSLRQERNIATTETVQIDQDLNTGRLLNPLLEAPDEPEVPASGGADDVIVTEPPRTGDRDAPR